MLLNRGRITFLVVCFWGNSRVQVEAGLDDVRPHSASRSFESVCRQVIQNSRPGRSGGGIYLNKCLNFLQVILMLKNLKSTEE
jgi:hypothetical protein